MRKTRILIAEEVPSLNKGEAAILHGMLETFKSLGEVEVSLFSFHPKIDEKNYPDIKIINVLKNLRLSNDSPQSSLFIKFYESTISLFQYVFFAFFYRIGLDLPYFIKKDIWREYCRADVIIIGHDGTFASPFGQVLIFSHACNILLARVLKKPVVIYSGDAIYRGNMGILKNWLWETLFKLLLNNVNMVTLREEFSYSHLKKLGVKSEIYLTADVAFLLKPSHEKRVKEIMLEEGIVGNVLIGMTVTQLHFHNAFPDLENLKDKYKKYIELIANVVNYLTLNLNATVVFVPHCIGPGNLDDRIIAKDIYRLVKKKSKVKVMVNDYSSSELKGLIGQFDLFIGERTHSLISAISMGVPSLALTTSKDHRTHGIIGKMLGQEKWVYNLENLNLDGLISKINNLWDEKENVRSELLSKRNIVEEQALLNGKLLRDLLRRLNNEDLNSM